MRVMGVKNDCKKCPIFRTEAQAGSCCLTWKMMFLPDVKTLIAAATITFPDGHRIHVCCPNACTHAFFLSNCQVMIHMSLDHMKSQKELTLF
jgi:hypothetical protein